MLALLGLASLLNLPQTPAPSPKATLSPQKAKRVPLAPQKPLAPRYSLENIGAYYSIADDLTPSQNATGQVSAWETTPQGVRRGVVFDSGQTHLITGIAEFPDVFPADIDPKGRVIGILKSPSDIRRSRAFLWESGKTLDLGTLGGKYASARAINTQGNIVGSAMTAKEESHAALWENGQLRDLGTLPKGDFSIANAINAQGHIVGASNRAPNGKGHATLWKEGKPLDLGLLPGGSLSSARSINDRGEIVGWADNGEAELQAVLWRNGKPQNLGTLGDEPCAAWSINNLGQVVGAAATSRKRMHAFLWEQGKMTDLNALIPANSGWTLQHAYRISNSGVILGVGLLGGQRRIFRLTPLPKSSAALPAGSSVASVSRSRRFCALPKALPAEPPLAPDFRLKDTQGALHSLREYRGKSVALFFFCGCRWCAECARAWGDIQRSGVLDKTGENTQTTLVVFQGDAEAANRFAKSAGLEMRQTTLLPDRKLEAFLAYRALPCPRAYALDAENRVRYVNNHADDAPQKASAATILSRLLTAQEAALQESRPPTPSEDPKLTVPPQAHIETFGANAARRNFGNIDPLTAPLLRQTFLVKNESGVAARLSVQATCGCTSALLSSDGKTPLTRLAPRQTAQILLTLKTSHLKPGSFSKYVYLFANQDPVPAASLELIGVLRETVSFTPKTLNFATFRAGTSPALRLEAILDARLKPKRGSLALICNNPSVRLSRLAPEKTVMRGGRPMLLQTYAVRLAPTLSIGTLRGEIFFPPQSPIAPDATSDAPVTALGGAWAALAGEAQGILSAMPKAIVFGSVAMGDAHTNRVTLQADSLETLRGLQARCSKSFVRVKITNIVAKGASGDPEATLETTLTEKTPEGGQQAEVIVQTLTGQRLALPLIYNVFRLTPK